MIEIINYFSVPWTACLSSPCDNGATCTDVNVDTFICSCRDGFFGTEYDQSKLQQPTNQC